MAAQSCRFSTDANAKKEQLGGGGGGTELIHLILTFNDE